MRFQNIHAHMLICWNTRLKNNTLQYKTLFWQKNLKFILKNNRQVFAGFHFSAGMMKVDAKEPIMSSNDWVMNGAIGFSVWYSTRHLFNSAAVLARNLKFTVIKGSLIVGNFCYLPSVVWFWDPIQNLTVFTIFSQTTTALSTTVLYSVRVGEQNCKEHTSILERFL